MVDGWGLRCTAVCALPLVRRLTTLTSSRQRTRYHCPCRREFRHQRKHERTKPTHPHSAMLYITLILQEWRQRVPHHWGSCCPTAHDYDLAPVAGMWVGGNFETNLSQLWLCMETMYIYIYACTHEYIQTYTYMHTS